MFIQAIQESINKISLDQARLKYFWSVPRVRIQSFDRHNDKFQQELKKLAMRRMIQPKINKNALILRKNIELRKLQPNKMSYNF